MRCWSVWGRRTITSASGVEEKACTLRVAVSSFTRQYKAFRLVYVETFDDPVSAITREKQMKKWNRDWKIRLIEEQNPDWRDLTGLLQ